MDATVGGLLWFNRGWRVIALLSPVIQRPTVLRRPSLDEWNALLKPDPGQGDAVVPGRRADEPLPTSMTQVRQQVARLSYLPLDPFVASVGGSVSADQVEIPKGEATVAVALPDFYEKDVEVMMGTHNGPGAPMLVILPGIHSSGESSHNLLLRKLALERGMNYLVLPNSLSEKMLDHKPCFHPGNPRVDAMWAHQLVGKLKSQQPEYFGSISVAGYSYGGLEGANLIRLDEEGPNRLIDGGLVAFSPPENLEHSMLQLDGLRENYEDSSGTIADTGLRYKHDAKKLGYARFMESPLAKHGPGTNVDEIEIADTYGSRDGLKTMIELVDSQFDHLLPMNTPEYLHANPLEKIKMRQEHKRIVENITYAQFSDEWMSKDTWLHQQGLTPTTMAEKYSFSRAMDAIKNTPVMVLAAGDDYILAPSDVEEMRNLENHSGPLEVARVFDNGGHVSVDWNPAVAETAIDFAVAAPHLKA